MNSYILKSGATIRFDLGNIGFGDGKDHISFPFLLQHMSDNRIYDIGDYSWVQSYHGSLSMLSGARGGGGADTFYTRVSRCICRKQVLGAVPLDDIPLRRAVMRPWIES